MHLSDALLSPPVAIGGGIITAALIGLAAKKAQNSTRPDIVPLMGVMGAFVFAAQMINFAIPGTGSSGHLIGGILLAAILGPWCAFLTLSSILIVQCLFFADGGLMALGCNIFNMAAISCLVAYPLIYKPIAGNLIKSGRIIAASVISCILALEVSALAVTFETTFSGITALPFSTFLKFMLPIHLAIGTIEGVVTASLLLFLAKYRPSVLLPQSPEEEKKEVSTRKILAIFGGLALILGAGFTILASSFPDGLEWSVDKVAGLQQFEDSSEPLTAFMPDYDSNFAGIIGSLMVMMLLWALSSLIFSKLRKS